MKKSKEKFAENNETFSERSRKDDEKLRFNNHHIGN